MWTTLWLRFHVTHGESVLWGYELWRSETFEALLLLLSHRDTEAAGLLIPEGGPSIPAQDTHSQAPHSCASPRPSSAFLPLPPVSLTTSSLSLSLFQICFIHLQTSSSVSIFFSFQDINSMRIASTCTMHKLLILITALERQLYNFTKNKKSQLLTVI